MSTIDTSTWNPDADLNTAIEGIPLNSDAGIAQTWQALRILMAAVKGDGDAIKAMIDVMLGATASADGASGLVPQPLAGDQDKVLKGDGTWGAVAAASHTHAGTEVSLTGYSKPSSTSAIAATDTVNAAIGKLEKALDGKQASGSYAADSAVVHLAGTETITGEKTFSGVVAVEGSGVASHSFTVKNDTYTMRFGVGSAGVNRGVWDENLNKWIFYASATESFFNGTVNSNSDERLKTPLEQFPDAVLDAWEEVDWGQFRYLADVERGNARIHAGVVAQRILEAFARRGLDAEAYDLICRSDAEGTAEDFWVVRYIEALSMEAACQRRRADRLERRIAAIEEALNG